MLLINLTPHKIIVYKENKIIKLIEPSGELASCKQVTKEIGNIEFGGEDIPLFETYHTDIKGIPDPEEGVIYIVPLIVASKLPNRQDLVFPCDYVRDEEGKILGCQGFMRIVNHSA